MDTTVDVHTAPALQKAIVQSIAPVLALVALAPIIAEVLLGNLIFGQAFVQLLVIDMLLYGSAALLIREIARRRGLGWAGIIVLALAAGVVEEGFVLQTLFNPHNPALEWMKQYGYAFDVNWFWALYVLGLHAVWSITIPILLTEALFPRLQSRPWLGRAGLGMDVAVYLLSCLILGWVFRSFTHFFAPPLPLIGAALLVAGLVALALAPAARLAPTTREKEAPARWLAGLLAFLAAALFSAFFVMLPNIPGFPLWLAIALYVGLFACVTLRIWRWSTRRLWGDRQRLALASGALIETMLFGFLLVARGSRADIILHIVLCVVFLGLLVWVGRTLRVSTPGPAIEPPR